MNPDELEPRPAAPKPRDLESMSLTALNEYIADLEREIARVRETIGRKHGARSAADSVFRR
ncbi:MAG: DUF1192 domain-containing protein [Alphaproteobacteria bacterium]|nr:DUF1192 domain-containing protein [Alphaproteobacteria bacterium]